MHLYHYQPFDAAFLERLLATNCIYLSDTKGFNDPWDCRPWFDSTRLDDPTFYQRVAKFYEDADRKRNTHLSEDVHQKRVARLRSDRPYLEGLIARMSGGIVSDIQKRYRVYCLTTKPADTLMWSHYAENHTGICLEFGRANEVLNRALPVAYCETYPLLDLTDDSRTALSPLLTKAKAWEYEEEYRLIAQEEAEALNHDSLITKKNLLLLPDGALTSIVVGCVASEATRDAVRDIVRRSSRDLNLKHAVRKPNHYSLTIKDMT